MSSTPQAQKKDQPGYHLDRRQVRLALVARDWTQSDLAKAVGCSLTTANLCINHGHFESVALRIKKELNL